MMLRSIIDGSGRAVARVGIWSPDRGLIYCNQIEYKKNSESYVSKNRGRSQREKERECE